MKQGNLIQEVTKYPLITSPEELQRILKSGKRGWMNVAEEVYHAGPGLSQSVLKGYEESPAHAKMTMDRKNVSTDAMRLGSACHAAVFEPNDFNDRYAVIGECDKRTKEGKAMWQSFLDANPGRDVLRPDDMEAINGICRTLSTHPYFEYIKGGHGYAELAYYWDSLGELCKAKYDWITTTKIPLEEGQERIIFDLKTTEYGVTDDDCEKTMKTYGYDVQSSWYTTPLPDARFVFIFASKKPPFAINFFEPGDETRKYGHAKIDKYFALHKECQANRSWPAHNGQINTGK